MENFDSLGLPESLIHTLAHMEFTTPTPIQAQGIPPALEGRDILGSAQTGTGKTAAFGIPLVTKLLANPRGTALVMTPTRELASQVLGQLQSLLGKRSPIKTALLIGGDSMPKQVQQLRLRPRLLVGTPGRINDHLERGNLMLHDASFLVLDETDRMLDMGFTIQIEKILKFLPKKRQTLLFSATLPQDIVKISKKYLTDPVRISVDNPISIAPKIKQEVMYVADADKYQTLLEQLDTRDGSIIVFVKTKYGTEKMAKKLRKLKYSADAIHGDLRQNRRDKVIANFRESKFRILVATDIAARGLDIPHIEHVINYDLPQCPEDYIHRIGRTARAGAEGNAVCFVSPSDKDKWRAITRMLDSDGKGSSSESSSQPRRGGGGGRPNRSRNSRNRKPDGSPSSGGRPSTGGKHSASGKPSAGGSSKPRRFNNNPSSARPSGSRPPRRSGNKAAA